MSISIPKSETQLHIVALGSSFAAGPGIPPAADKGAGRSAQNYAHILAARLGARLTDLSVSGATLQNLLDEPQVFFGRQFPPQVSELPADADIVTITGGGNDIGYVGGMMRDCLAASFVGRIIGLLRKVPNMEVVLMVEAVRDRLVAIIDKIHEVAPKTRIYLVEYLTLLGPDTQPGVSVSLSAEQIKRHQEVAAMLQEGYQLAAAARPEVEVIPIAELSREHALGSKEPWVEGFSLGVLVARKAPFHPNAEGMRNVARILEERLESPEGTWVSRRSGRVE